MAAHDTASRGWWWVLSAALWVGLAGLGASCASVSTEQALPPQTITANPAPDNSIDGVPATDPTPVPTAKESAPASNASAPPARPSDPNTVVIEEGGATAPRGLVEASRAERQRRAQSGPPVAVITSKNLREYATGSVTTGPSPAPAATAEAAGNDAAQREIYWRQRLRDLRGQWRRAFDAIEPLEREAEGLRTRFYAADDPYVRDAQIKPAWDHALEEIRRNQAAIRRFSAEVAEALEEGRVAGALAAWLREGAELEPPAQALERPGAATRDTNEPDSGADSSEPRVLGEPPSR